MRILHIASGDFFSMYGGGQVYVKNVVDTMIDLGLDLAVISFTAKCDNVVEKSYLGKMLLELSNIGLLEEAIIKVAPTIIHVHSTEYEVCKVAKKLNIPVVITAHHGGLVCPAGSLLNNADQVCIRKTEHNLCLPCVLRETRMGLKFWYPFMKYLNQNAYVKIGKLLQGKPFIPFITPIGGSAYFIQAHRYRFSEVTKDCNLMIAPCNKIGEAMINNGLDPHKLRVIPHGIPLPKDRHDYPQIIDGKLKFYYVGRICYGKGIHVLLDALSKVNNSKIELHLIGGSGNKYEQIYMEKLQRQYKSDKRIIWHGKITPDKVFETTKDFHVLISPSICLEAYGLNIAEALALGKPVLTTNSGGGEMQISDGYNGWIVTSNDSDALAEKLEDIYSHCHMLAILSKNCHAISISDHCQDLLKTYNALTN